MKAAAVGAPAVAAARGAKHRFAPVSSALAMVTLLLFLLVERAGSAATVEANGTRQVEGAGEGQHRELYAEQGIGRRIGRRCWTSYDGVSRCQANVFFIGVSKAGTTSLAYWMTHHPALKWVSNARRNHATPPGEESHVFDAPTDAAHETMVKLSLLPNGEGRFAETAPVAVFTDKVIDYTPHYAIMTEVPYRIRKLYGKSSHKGSMKFFVTLREPVARTISSWEYKFDLTAPHGNRSLEKAVQEDIKKINGLIGCLEKHSRPLLPWSYEDQASLDFDRCYPPDFIGDNLFRAHVAKSMYAIQLERWFTLFGRENIKVIFMEELEEDPVKTLEDIFGFIRLDLLNRGKGPENFVSREKWEDIVKTKKKMTKDNKKQILAPQVTPEIVEYMRDFFAQHNAKLEELLGRPVPDNWSTPAAPLGV